MNNDLIISQKLYIFAATNFKNEIMLDSFKTKTPLSKIVSAFISTFMTGIIMGAGLSAVDLHESKLATICGISSVIIAPILVLYIYSIFKTVDFKNKEE